jgi:hypothetical protein
MSVSWCGIFSILGIVLFIGIIASLLAGAKNLRPLLKGLGIIFLVLIGVTILATIAAIVIPQINATRAQKVATELPPSSSPVSSLPLEMPDTGFEPDIYPSFESAAKGLAKKLADRKEEGYRLGTVKFTGEFCPTDKNRLQNLIDQAFSEKTATTSSSQPAGKVMDIVVEEPCTESQLQKIVFRGKTVSTTFTFIYEASYACKDWVDNFPRYMASNSGQYWLVARSGTGCTSETEATQQAYQDAARKLLPYVEGQFRRFRLYRDIREDELLPLILSHLQGSMGEYLVKDQFVQSYRRPYGTIWSKSLLLNAQPSNILTLERACRNEFYGGLMSTGYVVLCGLVLMGVICLLYWLVNSYTKGYYTWPLRTGVVIVILGIVEIVLIRLRGGF